MSTTILINRTGQPKVVLSTSSQGQEPRTNRVRFSTTNGLIQNIRIANTIIPARPSKAASTRMLTSKYYLLLQFHRSRTFKFQVIPTTRHTRRSVQRTFTRRIRRSSFRAKYSNKELRRTRTAALPVVYIDAP